MDNHIGMRDLNFWVTGGVQTKPDQCANGEHLLKTFAPRIGQDRLNNSSKLR